MAAFAGFDLKKWREAQGMTAADLAEIISCDATTIYRYESGKIKANPDVMFEICTALGDQSKWYDWMRTEYPTSYGRVHPEQPAFDIKGAIMALYAGIEAMKDIQAEVFRDACDGAIDNQELKRDFKAGLCDLLQSTQRLKNIIGGD